MSAVKWVGSVAALLWSAMAGVAGERYVFATYGVQQGLTNLVVNQICQDHGGLLWVGTENGLFQFDGHRFQMFGTADGLPNAFITALYETPDGALWVGTLGGLAWRDGTHFVRPKDRALRGISLPEGFASDRGGHLYVATTTGLAVLTLPLHGAELKPAHIPGPPGVERTGVRSVFIDSRGDVWLGCAGMICRFRNGRMEPFSEAEGVPKDAWDHILEDRAGNLWARSARTLLRLEPGAHRFHAESDETFGLSSQTHAALALDRRGTLIVPTNRGLVMGQPGHWSRAGHRQGLPMNAVNATFEDAGGALWVGTAGTGLARWAGYREWSAFSDFEGLPGDDILSVLGDSEHAIWAGTSSGLARGAYTDGEWHWREIRVPGVSYFSRLAAAPDGAIWIMPDQRYLFRLDPKTLTTRRFGPLSVEPTCITFDRDGRLWITSADGLFRVDDPTRKFEPRNLTPAIAGKTAFYTEAITDAHGNLWAATFRGLVVFSDGKWRMFEKKDGLKSNRLIDLAQAPDGSIWVSYQDPVGADRVRLTANGIAVENFNRTRGLPSGRVYSMHVDRGGRLWSLTDNGAAVFDGQHWLHYGESGGLVSGDCNARAFWSDPDGGVWIGTSRGLARFQPLSTPQTAGPARAHFSSIQVGSTAIDPDAAKVTIRDGAPLSLRFSARALDRPNESHYRYRVIGLDPAWQSASRPELTLNYLPAGQYRLEVEANVEDSAWGEPAASLAVAVLPRWHEAFWFRALLAALIALSLWLLWLLRTRRFAATRRALEREVGERTAELVATNRELSHQIAEREAAGRERQRLEEQLLQSQKLEAVGKLAGGIAHDFNNLLTVITGYADLALEQLHPGDELHRPLSQIQRAGERAAELTQQLLAFSRKQMVHPVRIDLNRLVAEWREMIERLVGEEVQLKVRLAPGLPEVLADPNRLLQVCLNLATNSRDALGTGGGEVWFETGQVEIAEGATGGDAPPAAGLYVTLAVADAGSGMDEATRRRIFEPFFTTKEQGKGTGLGLATVYGIVKQAGGHIGVWSEPGRGTRFTIYLPIANS